MPLVRYGEYYSIRTETNRVMGDEVNGFVRTGRLDVIPMQIGSRLRVLSVVIDDPYQFIEVKLTPEDRDDLVKALLRVEVNEAS